MTDDSEQQDDLRDVRKLARSASELVSKHEREERDDERFRRATAALKSAFSSGADQDELEARYEKLEHAAKRSGNKIDDDLKAECEQRIDELDSADRRRAWRQTTLVFLASLVVLALIGGGVFYWWYRGQVATVVSDATSLIGSNRLDDAEKLLTSVKEKRSWLARAAAIREVETTLNTHQSQEEVRRKSFREAIEIAEAAGVETPDQSALAEAKELARTEDELASVRKLESGIIAYMDKERGKKEEELKGELESIADVLGRLEANPQLDTVPAELPKLSSRLQQVDVLAVDFGLASEVDAARRRVEAVREAREQDMKRGDAEARITSAIGECDRYVAAIRSYKSDFPESPLSKDFEAVVDEENLWRGMDAWNNLARRSQLSDLRNLTPEEVASLGQEVNKTITEHPDFPQQNELQHLSPFLEAVSCRSGGGEGLVTGVKETFSDPLVFGLLMVQTTDGKKYYVTDEPKEFTTEVRFSYLIDFAQGLRDAAIKKDEVVRTSDDRPYSRAPQSLLAEAVLHHLNQLGGTNWEPLFYQIIYAVATQKDVDPVLRVTLLKKVLETGCKGSHPLQLGFAKHLELLENPGFSTLTNWMDPDSAGAKQVQEQAALLLDDLPDVASAGKAAANYLRRFANTKFTTYQWIGWLKRISQSEWTCEHQPAAGVSGNLVIIRKASSRPELLTIGSVSNGQVRLTSATSSFVAGRPVYVQIRPNGP